MLVPHMHTFAPAEATPSAMPNPIPLFPPVTSTTFPERSKGLNDITNFLINIRSVEVHMVT